MNLLVINISNPDRYRKINSATWKINISFIGQRITIKFGAEVMIIIQNKKITNTDQRFFNITKRDAVTQSTTKGTKKDHLQLL